MLNSELHTRTLQLLRNRPASLKLKTIADDTGIKLSWLQDFSWSRSPDPGVNKVETLYVYLTDKRLSL